jgi:hypothetical protein
MLQILCLLICLSNLPLWAGVIKSEARHFQVLGKVASFSWAPERYPDDFRYDILYYIPLSLVESDQVRSLVFLHGGGSSTLTRAGSLKVAASYMKNDIRYWAEELQTIVVVPSGSGLNWGGHSYMLRDLLQLMRKELDLDSNNIGLSGHSMGGMGITRAYSLLADEFTYFMPIAAGMDIKHQTEHHLNKVFNVPYVHLQGLFDHFEIFIERCEEHFKRILQLENRYRKLSQFELIYYPGPHNFDYELSVKTLRRLQQRPRNIYQTELHGSLYSSDRLVTENEITFHQGSVTRYFWVQLLEFNPAQTERFDFHARISQDSIFFEYDSPPKSIKSIRILLSRKLINLEKEIKIYMNGKYHTSYKADVRNLRPVIDPTDKNYFFEDSVDLKL